jgi:hypothetical protein
MATQPRGEDPVPRKWKTKWYHLRFCFLRRLSRFLRMPAPLDVEQALRDEQWRSLQHGREQGLACCPEHPDEPPMMKIRPSDYRCPLCWNADFFRTIDARPITEPRQLQVVIPTQRPQQIYLQARKEGAGSHTAALEAIPKWLREKGQQ